jgi:uncharacterized protein DUF4115
MPITFREKLIAAVGFAAVLLLALLAFTGGNSGDGAGTVANPPPPPPPPATTTPGTTTTPPPATTTGRQPQPGDARLVVKAARGDSPLSVHADSEEGESLYDGVLAQGRSVSLFGPRLWIRLGAAENVDLTLDGRPVERLPAGSLDLLATPGQLQAAS